MTVKTQSLGYPRIGERRELKKAIEAYWKGTLSLVDLELVGTQLRRENWLTQQKAGIDLIPSNDFSFYDQVLDMSCLLGNVPKRFGWTGESIGLDLRFRIARGVSQEDRDCGCGAKAGEMTKWFDTNYHYIVPEFCAETAFALSAEKPFAEFQEALELGIRTKPVLIGPLTYLWLGKAQDGSNRLTLLKKLLPVYCEILRRLAAQGVEWVQLDEPVLCTDLEADWLETFVPAYEALRAASPGLRIVLATYFGELRENFAVAAALPVDVLHVDATRDDVQAFLPKWPRHLALSLGVVDGRNVWRNDFDLSLERITAAQQALGSERVLVAPSSSLLHAPVTLRHESTLDGELKEWLAFAEEKLVEVVTLARLSVGEVDAVQGYKNRVAIQSRRASARIHRPDVKRRCAGVSADDCRRKTSFQQRKIRQQEVLALPLFPTTTIGSFPQTPDVRIARARWKKGELSDADYQFFLRQKTAECVRFQEQIGLDVLVHGEFERNDMVEYFGEQLEGFAFTANGWVQSYGSRCVKPPIIFGDVSRSRPMTVEWSTYAQSLASRPMKGMLTGPITILQWSFVRDDQPRRDTAWQIALAIREEVADLETAGLKIIQIDEPALREGLPLRRSEQRSYLEWATEAFRLSASGVKDETQIHTHMCYCEFNDIMDSIAALDADVISIETSRSQMELLEAFVAFNYPNDIGPGVWDIHSPRVPEVSEMIVLLQKAGDVLPVENLWVNPDCGLKTRGWTEVTAALKNMVEAARRLRVR